MVASSLFCDFPNGSVRPYSAAAEMSLVRVFSVASVCSSSSSFSHL